MANSSKSKKDFMGVLSDIEKLKKGLTKDPKVHKALRGVESKGGKLPSPMMKMYGPFKKESIDESWLDAKKIQLKYRKEIAYIKKHNSGTGSKKEQDLLDAISSILSNKEKGDWSDPDFADIQALELIWDNEWKRLK